MHGCLRVTAARKMLAREDGLECPLVPPPGSARSPQLAVATQ